MRESLVRFGLLVHVLTTLYGVTHVVGSIHDLGSQALSHGALAALTGEHNQPAQSQSLTALRTDFHRNLVGSAADTTGLALQGGHDVGDGGVEYLHGLLAGLLSDRFHGFVANGLRNTALAVVHDLVDQLSNDNGIIYRTNCGKFLKRWEYQTT